MLSDPAIFLIYIENILQECKDISMYMDDIPVMGMSTIEYLGNLESVLRKLELVGLYLNQSEALLFVVMN